MVRLRASQGFFPYNRRAIVELILLYNSYETVGTTLKKPSWSHILRINDIR